MNAKDIAYGYAIGYNDGIGQGGGDTPDVWKLPENWIDIPEPQTNQIVMLIEISENDVDKQMLPFRIRNGDGSAAPIGTETIDWGDGQSETMTAGNFKAYSHTYTSVGQYIIKINCSDNINCIQYDSGCINLRAIKHGINTFLYESTYFNTAHKGVVYVKFYDVAKETYYNCFPRFQEWYSLQKIDFAVKPDGNITVRDDTFKNCRSLICADFTGNFTQITSQMFQNCYALQSVDLSNAIKIDSGTFAGCVSLKEVNAPKLINLYSNFYNCYSLKKFTAPLLTEMTSTLFANYAINIEVVDTPSLTSITNSEFSGCYKLRTFNYAAGCNFNGNTFSECPALYPKPQ